jgi:hypothetical protein
MRRIVCLLAGAGILAGCASHHPKQPPADAAANRPPKKKQHEKLIVTPEIMPAGKIVRVNNVARFIVINYPIGNMPGYGQHLGVFRQGAKVGEIRITGPQQDDNTVADVVSGEVQIGDDVRAN